MMFATICPSQSTWWMMTPLVRRTTTSPVAVATPWSRSRGVEMTRMRVEMAMETRGG